MLRQNYGSRLFELAIKSESSKSAEEEVTAAGMSLVQVTKQVSSPVMPTH